MSFLSRLRNAFRKPDPAAPINAAVQAYRDSLTQLHAEKERELASEIAAESPESRALAREIAKYDVTPTQAARMAGRESVIPLRPTAYARKAGRVKGLR